MTNQQADVGHRRVADPAPVPCKVCDGDARLVGVVDFNKHCPVEGLELGLSGMPVYYRQCGSCGSVFTNHCDEWGPADFAANIYNDQYQSVDPDYVDVRAQANARWLNAAFGAHRERLSCLDYGGGNGRLSELLGRFGFARARSFDPFDANVTTPPGRNDLLTSFEVLEHVAWPRRTIADMAALIGDDGIAVFSTLVVPSDFAAVGVNWWYLAPRNGHITLYSRKALALLWAQHGFRLGSFNDNMHVAFRTVPAFAAQLIKVNPAAARGERKRA